MNDLNIALVLLGIVVVYAILIGFISWGNSNSGVQAAHENFPKTVKHVSQSFVSVMVFLLLFYLAINKLIPSDVLITLVAVFSTAGFLTLRDK